ncbi:MAG: zinc-ribbon domain-containing protein [Methanobrevibacter sp.]|nr:zinc-ribbon domain-containing protein [Methanobrevibacter sp.]
MKYCTRCGNELKDDDIFCGKCGYKQDSHTTENNQEELKNLNQNDNSNLDSKDKPPKDKGRKKEKGPRKRIHAKSVWALIFAILCLITRGAALISLFFGFMAVLFFLLDLIFHGKKRTRNHVLSFIALGVIFFNVIGINIIQNGIFNIQKMNEEEDELAGFGYSISEEELKNTESDIVGMSLFDKAKMGLDVYNGSDSDNDGLTDKDEIELYNSDPLKMSTSGDLIPDSYKVAMNLELNEKYNLDDYDLEAYSLADLYKSPENVTIDSDNPENAFAKIREYNTEYCGQKSIEGYELINVYGDVSIDFSDCVEDDKEYIAVVKNGSEINQVELENGVLNTSLTRGDFSNIDIYESTQLAGYNEAIILVKVGLFGMLDDYVRRDSNQIYKRNIFIYEIGDQNEDYDKSAELTDIFEKEFETENLDVHHEYVSKLEFKAMRRMIDFILPVSKKGDHFFSDSTRNAQYPKSSDIFIELLFNKLIVYQHLEAGCWEFSEPAVVGIRYYDIESANLAEIVLNRHYHILLENEYGSENRVIANGFDLKMDTFGFANSEAGDIVDQSEGICSGFAYATAARFDGIQIPRTLTYDGLSYDLSDPRYDSIFDKNLEDFHYNYYLMGDCRIEEDENKKGQLALIDGTKTVDVNGKKYAYVSLEGKIYNTSILNNNDVNNNYDSRQYGLVNIYGDIFGKKNNKEMLNLVSSDMFGNRIWSQSEYSWKPKKHSIVDEEVAKYLKLYWSYTNDVKEINCYENTKKYVPEYLVKALQNYVNNGNIACISYWNIDYENKRSNGHTNNVFGYINVPDSEEIILLTQTSHTNKVC